MITKYIAFLLLPIIQGWKIRKIMSTQFIKYKCEQISNEIKKVKDYRKNNKEYKIIGLTNKKLDLINTINDLYINGKWLNYF